MDLKQPTDDIKKDLEQIETTESLPPYTTNQQPDSSANPIYAPQPHHTQAPSRTLNVYHTGWSGSRICVKDTDRTTVLYNISTHLLRPQMKFESAPTKDPIGTVRFRSLKSRIETTVHDQAIVLESRGFFKNGYFFNSPTFHGKTMTWKGERRFDWYDIVCVDEADMPVARFTANGWSLKKCGRLELYGPESSSGIAMDEIVVTGLAILEYRVRASQAAAAS